MKLILVLFFALTAFAGNERGNGGQSIYIGDNAFLRDIVEVNNCSWHSPALVKMRYPKVNEVLESIKNVHWLTVLKMNEEFSKLNFCFTKKRLPPLSYNNTDDLYIFTNQLFDQPAVNDGGIIFIDINLFEKMDEVQQAFLFLHEVSHELFDKKEERQFREPRLRQFILNTYQHYINPVDTATFVINVDMAKFKYLRGDISNLNEIEIKSIYNNTVESEEVITNYFFKYRRFVENLDATYEIRNVGSYYNYEFPQEDLFLTPFSKNLKEYRTIARNYTLSLLKNREIQKLNKLNIPELYRYFENDFLSETRSILEDEISEYALLEHKDFFAKIGDNRINDVLIENLIKDQKSTYTTNETTNIVINAKNLTSFYDVKAVVMNTYDQLFNNNFIQLNYINNFLREIDYFDVSKHLTSKYIVKLYTQFNSLSFTSGILDNEEVIRSLTTHFETILTTSGTIHKDTLSYFLTNGKKEELKNLIRKNQNTYLASLQLLSDIINTDSSLIDFNIYSDVEIMSSVSTDIYNILLTTKVYMRKNEYREILENVFLYVSETDRGGLLSRKTYVKSYSVKDPSMLEKLALYTSSFSKSQKKEFKNILSDFVKDLEPSPYDQYTSKSKFSSFKSQVKQQILSFL